MNTSICGNPFATLFLTTANGKIIRLAKRSVFYCCICFLIVTNCWSDISFQSFFEDCYSERKKRNVNFWGIAVTGIPMTFSCSGLVVLSKIWENCHVFEKWNKKIANILCAYILLRCRIRTYLVSSHPKFQYWRLALFLFILIWKSRFVSTNGDCR